MNPAEEDSQSLSQFQLKPKFPKGHAWNKLSATEIKRLSSLLDDAGLLSLDPSEIRRRIQRKSNQLHTSMVEHLYGIEDDLAKNEELIWRRDSTLRKQLQKHYLHQRLLVFQKYVGRTKRERKFSQLLSKKETAIITEYASREGFQFNSKNPGEHVRDLNGSVKGLSLFEPNPPIPSQKYCTSCLYERGVSVETRVVDKPTHNPIILERNYVCDNCGGIKTAGSEYIFDPDFIKFFHQLLWSPKAVAVVCLLSGEAPDGLKNKVWNKGVSSFYDMPGAENHISQIEYWFFLYLFSPKFFIRDEHYEFPEIRSILEDWGILESFDRQVDFTEDDLIQYVRRHLVRRVTADMKSLLKNLYTRMQKFREERFAKGFDSIRKYHSFLVVEYLRRAHPKELSFLTEPVDEFLTNLSDEQKRSMVLEKAVRDCGEDLFFQFVLLERLCVHPTESELKKPHKRPSKPAIEFAEEKQNTKLLTEIASRFENTLPSFGDRSKWKKLQELLNKLYGYESDKDDCISFEKLREICRRVSLT